MKPPGSVVGLTFDTPRDVALGDEIVTFTGRRYLVVAVRRQTRGMHIGRWHLRCQVLEKDFVHGDSDAYVHTIRWYPRPKRRR